MALDLDFGFRGSAAGDADQAEAGSRAGRWRLRDVMAIAATLFAAALVSSLAVIVYLAQSGPTFH
jgi:hypothetical protein